MVDESSDSVSSSGGGGMTIYLVQVVAARRMHDFNDWVEAMLYDGNACMFDMKLDVLVECMEKRNVSVSGYSRTHVKVAGREWLDERPWTFFGGGHCIPLCNDFPPEFTAMIGFSCTAGNFRKQ